MRCTSSINYGKDKVYCSLEDGHTFMHVFADDRFPKNQIDIINLNDFSEIKDNVSLVNIGELMTFPEFDKFFDEFVEECKKMRDTKGKEYASSEDRFANFNRLAQTLDLDRLKIAQVYVQKHLDSIATYIKTGKIHCEERIIGRFIDVVTYMILMAGMVHEQELIGEKTNNSSNS